MNRSSVIYRLTMLGLAIVALLSVSSCDRLFVDDGDDTVGITELGGYFYCLDNTDYTLKMLDHNLRVLKSWPLTPLAAATSFQGITFDGDNLWVSVAGSTDMIFRLDASSDSLVVLNSFDAPPTARGTIRDLAWDGSNLWAINSGSETYLIPPTIYKLNPTDGAIIEEYPLPGPEPRGLGYVGPNGDVYGSGAEPGFYISDVTLDSIYAFLPVKKTFLGAFTAPLPPAGESYIFPVGLTFDGRDFWLINSSSLGDYLFQLDYTGALLNRIELPFTSPGPLVWANKDIRIAQAPVVLGVAPNTGARGGVLTVSITGNYFMPGAGLDVDLGEGIVIQTVNFVNSSTIQVDIEIADDAVFGPRDVTVTNPDGQVAIGTGLFTILSIDPLAGFLWLCDAETDSLFKIRISDTAIVARWSTLGLAPGGSTQGLAFDGAAVWMSAGGTDDAIYQLNTSGASLTSNNTIAAPITGSDVIRDLAFNGSDLWACNSTAAKIYKLNSATGAKLDSIATPGIEARGIVFADGNLYCNDRDLDSIYVYDFGNATWTAQFAVPIPPGGTTSNRFATGMAWDGINFWIANSTGVYDYLFQVTTTGTVLRTYEVPYRDAAQPSGLTFTQE